MTDIAIRTVDLSKQYHIGAHLQKKNFREHIQDVIRAPFRRAGKLLRGQATGASELDETIWALKDVSLEIKQGEVVGIIGRNGAGKSTLLKIISRITEPTEGFADIHGHMGSLLEVGTGFHPELSGRENIFLNGAILGMKKDHIRRKFDEIVAFAEVEKFIDTPVKHYSSGMYLRLAFAVAAHLDPEILLVDEVLAVGDAQFQKKCLNKMQDVGKEGRTVLFVSHNMSAVTRLCQRAIIIHQGQVSLDGPSHQVVSSYIIEGHGPKGSREWSFSEAPGGEVARLLAVRVKTDEGQVTTYTDIRKPVTLEMEYEVIKPGYKLLPHFALYNGEGIAMFMALDQDPLWRKRPRENGKYISSAIIPGNLLSEGMVFVEASNITLDPTINQFCEKEAVAFQVIDSQDGNSARGDWVGNLPGIVRPSLEWSTRFCPQ